MTKKKPFDSTQATGAAPKKKRSHKRRTPKKADQPGLTGLPIVGCCMPPASEPKKAPEPEKLSGAELARLAELRSQAMIREFESQLAKANANVARLEAELDRTKAAALVLLDVAPRGYGLSRTKAATLALLESSEPKKDSGKNSTVLMTVGAVIAAVGVVWLLSRKKADETAGKKSKGKKSNKISAADVRKIMDEVVKVAQSLAPSLMSLGANDDLLRSIFSQAGP